MQPTVLVVMDGVGLREEEKGNAFRQAETPNIDSLMEGGFEELQAYGPAVGLPEGYQGNSEVGHLHLGAGRRIPQRLKRINDAAESGELGEKKALVEALERAEENGTAVHLAGIISDGGIHGHMEHLEALLKITSRYGIEDVYVHCFTDGRDVAPKSAGKFLSQVEEWCDEYGAEIATVEGRYYAMDRDHNWDRTEKAYRAMALGDGFEFSEPSEAVEKTYREGDYDYFIQPSARDSYDGMNSEDELVFYNYRADREVQIARAFLEEGFQEFENPVRPNFTSMFLYEHDFDNPVLFEKQVVEDTLGEKIEREGMSQLRITESQKIPHVTYFFNGQRELEFENERREFVESDKIKAYDQKPEMHADDITDILVEAIQEGEHEFIMLNFPNCDLVGHTGDLDAAVTAVETVDRNIGRIVEAVDGTEYALVVTADHGNCEEVGSEEDPNTSHTLNDVPLMVYNASPGFSFEENELWEVEKLVEDLLELD
ncbi:MAG: 2,3-bisphosphoglycerate-independent phosphoglycerate mutase [Candidatus Nanohaloarchaea archaeon]